MQNNESVKKILKRLLVFVLIVSVISATAFLTIIALRGNTKIKTDNTSDKTEPAETTISALLKTDNLNSLSPKVYLQQPSLNSTINYKLGSKAYAISVDTNQSLIYFSKSKSGPNDITIVQGQIDAFMKTRGISKSGYQPNSSNEIKYILYETVKSVCQLSSSQPEPNSTAIKFHEISCINKTDIEKEYLAIENLLTVYKDTQKLGKFNQATRFTESEGSVSYSTVSLTTADKLMTLLFAKLDNKWSYLGDLSAGDKKYDNGKFIITTDIKEKIDDPKYKGFLIKKILGKS